MVLFEDASCCGVTFCVVGCAIKSFLGYREANLAWTRDYKEISSMSRCSTHDSVLQFNPKIENSEVVTIGLYRDVWIAAIASSRTRLATLSGVMCNTSQ